MFGAVALYILWGNSTNKNVPLSMHVKLKLDGILRQGYHSPCHCLSLVGLLLKERELRGTCILLVAA